MDDATITSSALRWVDAAAAETTLARPATLAGVGLHTGESCRLTIAPAAPGAGISVQRMDLADAPAIPVNPDSVAPTHLGTALRTEAGVSARTVEHVIAACAICRLDNAVLALDGPEAPIMDGSAAAFVDAIGTAGLIDLDRPRRSLKVTAPIDLLDRENDRWILIEPSPNRTLRVEIDFDQAAIGRQSVTLNLAAADDLAALATARTFCRRRDIDAMQAAGFGLGGGLDNALIVDGAAILNPGGLRHQHEFALHKALDLLGDLALIGAPIEAAISARKPGHALNTAMAHKLLQMV